MKSLKDLKEHNNLQLEFYNSSKMIDLDSNPDMVTWVVG